MLVNSANYGHRVGGRGHRGVLCPAPSPRLTRRSAVCVQSFAAWAEDGSCLQRGSRDSQRDYERCLESWDDCVEYAAQAARLHREIHASKERLVASGGELLSPSVAARRGGWPARGLENGPRGVRRSARGGWQDRGGRSAESTRPSCGRPAVGIGGEEGGGGGGSLPPSARGTPTAPATATA